MKKVLLGLFCVMALSFGSKAQTTIEDFDLLTIHQLSNVYPDDSNYVVHNPAPNGVDSSTRVLRFRRNKTGDVWAGFWSNDKKYDMTAYKYVSVHVWKPRISVVKFKVEGGAAGTFELASITPQTKVNEWEKLDFYYPDATGEYPTLAMLVDFNDPVGLDDDIVLYIDDITLRTAPVGGDSIVLEDFQSILLNQLSNGPLPNDSLKIVPNPAKDEVNMSPGVLRFRRSSAGDVWAGFWSHLPKPIDMTNNKYILVKVWKPRISTIKFKVEGGTTDPTFFELPSVDPQTKVKAWEQMVFYYPNATGTYPTIAMLPDFSDPVDLAEDTVLFIDDIVLSPTASGIPSDISNVEKQDFLVFPNPVRSILYFENLKEVDRISISNIVGQEVMVNHNINSERVSMNVSNLTNGIYMVSVIDKNGKATISKIVKQ